MQPEQRWQVLPHGTLAYRLNPQLPDRQPLLNQNPRPRIQRSGRRNLRHGGSLPPPRSPGRCTVSNDPASHTENAPYEAGDARSGCSHIDADHYLKEYPSDAEFPQALPTTASLSLPTERLSPKHFERLSYRIVDSESGSPDVYLYGKEGQAQHGIDLVAFFDEKPKTVYQVKHRREKFKASELAEAVQKYADGQRPFKATHLTIIVACEAHETAVIDKLNSLKEKYSDLKIRLWDRTDLSKKLESRPEIVRRFFGPMICDQFCGTNFTTLPEQISPIDSDALIRGPILHMNLSDDHKRAKSLLSTKPSEAAVILERIAEKLEDSPFTAYAVQLRREQASALEAAGQLELSLGIRLDIAWRLIDSTDLWTAIQILREISNSEADLPVDLERSARTLAEVVNLRSKHTGSLDELAARFDEMQERDLHRHTAAVALAEECTVARRTDLIRSRDSTLKRIAETQSSDNTGQMVTARILMSLADATGEWERLLTAARERYTPSITALIIARNARFNALASEPKIAMIRYLDAIERSTIERMYGDTRSWLYAHRTVRLWFPSFTEDIDKDHRLAQATETQGAERILAANNTRAHAMRSLLRHKWPDALEASKRYLWHSVVTASLTEELEASELIGEIFEETGRPLNAACYYIRAGHQEKAEKLGTSLAEESLDLSIEMLDAPHWERSAAYKLVTQASDLLTEPSAKAWASAALDDAITNTDPSYSNNIFRMDAFTAFAALSDAASSSDAERFIQFATQFVNREPGNYQLTDAHHIRALMRIAENNNKLRKDALRQTLELLLVADQESWNAFFEKDELLQFEVSLVGELFTAPAANGNTIACLGLIAAGADTSPVLAHAKQRLAQVTAERVHEPGVQHIGTNLMIDASLVSVLDLVEKETFVREMMIMASDQKEPSMNRGQALLAATQLVNEIALDTKGEIFKNAIRFAQGDYDSEFPNPFEISNDPLSRFKINLGPHSFRPIGLHCAACCAQTEDEISEVREIAFDLLRQGDKKTSIHIAQALGAIASELTLETVEALSAHPNEWIRAVAAVAWAEGTHPPFIGQALVKDSSALVRRSLAMALQDRPEHLSVREVLTNDPRRSIRSLFEG